MTKTASVRPLPLVLALGLGLGLVAAGCGDEQGAAPAETATASPTQEEPAAETDPAPQPDPRPDPQPDPRPEPVAKKPDAVEAAPAVAEQPTKEKDPEVAPVPKPAPAAEKDAAALLAECTKLRHLPANYGYTSLAFRGEVVVASMGNDPIVVRPTWKDDGRFDVGLELPESVTAQMPPEMKGMIEKQAEMIFRFVLSYLYVAPDTGLDGYDATRKDKDGKTYVELVPSGEATEFERRRLYLGEDGLVERELFTLHVDPEDPDMAMFMGVEIEVDFEYEQHGLRHAIKKLTAMTPQGEISGSVGYYEIGNDLLPKSVAVEMVMSAEPVELVLHDYQVDGKLVESTKAPEKPKDAPQPPVEEDPKPDVPK